MTGSGAVTHLRRGRTSASTGWPRSTAGGRCSRRPPGPDDGATAQRCSRWPWPHSGPVSTTPRSTATSSRARSSTSWTTARRGGSWWSRRPWRRWPRALDLSRMDRSTSRSARRYWTSNPTRRSLPGVSPPPSRTPPRVARCCTRPAPRECPRGDARRSRGGRPAIPESASVMLAQNIARLRGLDEDSVYLSPAPLYHSAPSGVLHGPPPPRRHVVVMEHFDAEECLGAIDRYRVTHAQFVPTMCSPGCSGYPRTDAPAPSTCLQPGVGRPCRSPLSGPGQAADARVVGPDHPRVLRRHRGHRVLPDHPRGVARPSGLGGAARGRGAHRGARRGGGAGGGVGDVSPAAAS